MEQRTSRAQKAKGFCDNCFSGLMLDEYQQKPHITAQNLKCKGQC